MADMALKLSVGGSGFEAHAINQHADIINALAAQLDTLAGQVASLQKQRVADVNGLTRDLAAAYAHRACCGVEHDPNRGKLHGYCVVCGVPWPCETAETFLRSGETDGHD